MTQAANNLGVLVIGRKRPGFEQEWNQIIRRRAGEALGALGFTSVGADSPVVDDETVATVLDRIKQSKCRALVILQPSLGAGQLALAVMQRWAGPIVLWATPERPEGDKVSSCSLVAQHLWASIFRQSNHPFEIVYGDPDDAALRQSLIQAIALSQTVAGLGEAKVGVVGSHAPGFLAMKANGFAMVRQLGVQLQDLSLVQFVERVRAIDESRVSGDVKSLRLDTSKFSPDDLAMSGRCYLAIRDLIAEEKLDALALQEWPELPNVLGQWPYLAMSRVADEGFPIAMEGDADAAVTLLAAKLAGVGTGFITDWLAHDARTITIWHAGIAPLHMLESVMLAQHFNIAKPLVVDGALKVNRPVTIARIWRCDDRYHVTAFEGQAIPPRRNLTGNHALMQVDGVNVNDLFDTLCHAGMPHHPVVFYGHHRETFRRLARMLRIEFLDL